MAELCHPDDREALRSTRCERVARGQKPGRRPPRVRRASTCGSRTRPPAATPGSALVASAIEPDEFAEPLLLAQWVDLSVRRRAEQARAELLLEQAARTHAEAIAERLHKLQALTDALVIALARASCCPSSRVRAR